LDWQKFQGGKMNDVKKAVLVFGNPQVENDSIALKVANALKGSKNNSRFSFEFVNSPEELRNYGKDLLIMDAVEGLDRVELIDGLDTIRLSPRITTHDFDLTFNLKLLEKAKKIDKVSIIGIPQEYQVQEAVYSVEKLLEKMKK